MSTMLFSTAVLFLLTVTSAILVLFGHEPAPGVAVALFLGFGSLLLLNLFFDWREYKHHPHDR